ncbi:hypothetical protein GCM10011391_04430 [Pullulanibacillus camelliae]|uniref:DUF6305 domain-containing protein n=1 Tax=Pullulanibacillus camelliae TaxID=1707096 RepID=A0A8J2VG42_9BACL|nr:DUF6305 family protein [Pullulanibacillus camelliae]GGE29015.1 hypothetical protein GCM10011391_04430 [Pullulanibacillus camelliae]
MMRAYIIPLLISLSIVIVAHKAMEAPKYLMYTLPNLPTPIGKEKVLITSAGQDPDGFIVQRMAQELHLSADYRPTALASDLYDYQTVVLVVGYSPNGLKTTIRSLEEEKRRVKAICKQTKRRGIPLILLHLGGPGRLDEQTMAFFREAAPYTHYLIGLRGADYSGYLRQLAKRYGFSITLVQRIQDMKLPMNSVFR